MASAVSVMVYRKSYPITRRHIKVTVKPNLKTAT